MINYLSILTNESNYSLVNFSKLIVLSLVFYYAHLDLLLLFVDLTYAGTPYDDEGDPTHTKGSIFSLNEHRKAIEDYPPLTEARLLEADAEWQNGPPLDPYTIHSFNEYALLSGLPAVYNTIPPNREDLSPEIMERYRSIEDYITNRDKLIEHIELDVEDQINRIDQKAIKPKQPRRTFRKFGFWRSEISPATPAAERARNQPQPPPSAPPSPPMRDMRDRRKTRPI